MEKPTALYRYVTKNGRVSKLYTMGGLKQVIRSYDRYFTRYKTEYYDTSAWVIERIPIKVDKWQSASLFLEEKTPKVFWEFAIENIGFKRAYLRATHKSAFEEFTADIKKEWPFIDMEKVEYTEYMGDINV